MKAIVWGYGVFLVFGMLFGLGILVTWAYRRKSARRECEKIISELEKLPPVTADFSTPEGAILCLEAASTKNDIEAAVACNDFATRAKLWLCESGITTEQLQKEMLPEMTKTMEKSFRESMRDFPSNWNKARSFFTGRSPYGDGLVVVAEVTVGPDRSLFRQRILTTETSAGWRVVTPLVHTQDGWKVTGPGRSPGLRCV